MKDSLVIRELIKGEEKALEDFLYGAIYTKEGEEKPNKNIIQEPRLRNYYKGFGRVGDLCLFSIIDNKKVGACWIRMFKESDKSYGFVEIGVPELSISVLPHYTNQGIGTQLMEQMMNLLRKNQIKKVSLSVDKDNYAYDWYLGLGFEPVSTDQGSVKMLLEV